MVQDIDGTPPVDDPVPKSVSVVIPVYNGGSFLKELTSRILEALELLHLKCEVLLIDDGSSDDSWRVISSLAAENSLIRGVALSRNFGQHNALLAGIRDARHSVIVTMDDDLQHPPEEIGKLLRLLSDQGSAVVYGAPLQQHYSLARGSLTQFAKITIRKVAGIEQVRDISAFRAFPTNLRDAFARYEGNFVDLDVLLSWATTRFVSVAVHHDARKDGESDYTFGRLLKHTFDLVVGHSVRPLQFASVLGFLLTIVGAGVAIYAIVRYAIGNTVPGFTFLASIVSIFSGTQLLMLGIFGEYLGRMHFNLLRRPTYVVESRTMESPDGATPQVRS